ncbi:MAG: sulfur globule family protein [Candidatus Paracaedibacteraceae bacterium]|nr:sulfur globule family protein [Candidatus Paracaedibacteraceae bacterium]
MIKFLSFLLLICFAEAETEIQHSQPQIGSHRSIPKKVTTTSQHTTATQSHQKKPETCPRNCIEAVHALDQVYHLRQQIEQAKHAQNPKYTMKTINQTKIQGSNQHCQADCAQVKGIQRQIEKYQADLAKIKATPAQVPPRPQATNHSTALVVHQPVATGTCPKNCHEAWYYLQEVYKLRQQIEQTKHAHNPQYAMKQIKAPTMQDSGQSCHADCPQVKGIQREVDKYKAELAKLKADHTNATNPAQPQKPSLRIPQQEIAAGTCPKNCHEAWYYLHEIHDVRQQIEQAKHAKNSSYQIQTIKPPTMQDSTQHCHGDCPQVLGIQRQLKKYQDELAAINAGNALPAPQQGLKGQCKPGCDNETALRIEIQNLNKKLDQLKHKADPSYRVKTYKPISAVKTGVTCPAGCNNLKQLEKRKSQLNQAITQMQSDHSRPIITEPDDDYNALVPYTGGNLDDDYSGPTNEDVTDQPQKQKKPGFFSRVKSKITSGASSIRNKIRKNPSSSGSNNQLVPYDNDDNTGGALVPYDDDELDNNDDNTGGALVPYDDDGLDDDYNQPLQSTSPSSGGYDPYGTDDDLDYSQGYGYNQNTGNYNAYNNPYGNQMAPYGQNYGYNPYGSSSTTHEESGPMYPYPYTGGEIFRSDQTDNQANNANTAAAAMTAFGSILGGLLSQQPAATVPAQQPAAPPPAPAQQPQQVSPQTVVPQDDGDLDDLYGGSGDYASTTGPSEYGSSNYGSSSSSYGSRSYSSPSTSSSYSSSSYSNPSSSSYGSSGASYSSRNSSSSYGSGYNSSRSGYDSDYDY